MTLRAAEVVFLLYVVALHCSIAAMETLAWLLFLLLVIDRVREGRALRWPLFWPLVGLIVCVAIGLLLNPPLKPFLQQFGFMRWVLLFWSFYWALERLWSPRFEQRLLRVWFVACAVLALYAVIQFPTGLDLRPGLHRLEEENGFFRTAGFFVNCLTFAYVMGASFFVVAKPAASILPRGGHFAFLLVGFAAILASMARGALVGAMVTAGLFLALNHRKWIPYFLAASVIALGALSTVWGKLGNLLHLRLDGSSLSRVHLWQAYWQMFLDHPLFGVGLLQGDKFLPEYYAKAGSDSTFFSHAHNVWMQWLGGAGGPALLLFLWISFTLMVWAWHLRSSRWGWPLFLAQVYLMIGGMSEAVFFDGEVNHLNVLVWSMTAFLFSHKEHLS